MERRNHINADPSFSCATDSTTYLKVRTHAASLFADRGYSNVGLRELAAHLGIKAGSIYNHIESKEVLLFELVEELYEDLLDVVTRPVRKRLTHGDRLECLIVGHLQLYLEKSTYFRVAEHASSCLTASHRQSIDGLVAQYERALLLTLSSMGAGSSSTPAIIAVKSIAALFHHLPHWVGDVDINSKAYRCLLKNMILGALAVGKPPNAGAMHSISITEHAL